MSHAFSRRAFLTTALGAASLPLFRLEAFAQATNQIELVARHADVALAGPTAPKSRLWTYNGTAPGPLLRARQGEELNILFRNELDDPTSVHWHGLRIDNAMDGVAELTQAPVQPGETFHYRFTPPDAGTYWYHAHNRSWEQVAMGLYGPLIVDEKDGPVFPNDLDFTLMFDDWRLNQQGVIDTDSLGNLMDWGHQGRLGNYLTVNGQSQPTIKVPGGQWLRLRLINPANARILSFDVSALGGTIIALDGQPVGDQEGTGPARISLAPAQRVDLRVRFEQAGRLSIDEVSSGRAFPAAYLEVLEPSGEPQIAVVPTLPPTGIPEPDLDHAAHFKMSLDGGAMSMVNLSYQGRPIGGMDMMRTGQMWGLNGIANMPQDPFFSVKAGQTVVVKTVNRTRFDHGMHIHGHHFRVIARNGKSLPLDNWRDTFLIGPNEEATIAFVADNKGKWLYHCHMLEHAAGGMTTWFEVV